LAKNEKATKSWGDVWSRQVSTIVTDFAKGVTDIIFEGGNLKDTLVGIFRETGLRALIEGLFTPLKGLLKQAGEWFANLLGIGGSGSKGGSVSGISLGSIGGKTLAGLAGAAGLGLGGFSLGQEIGGVGGAAISGAAIGGAAGIGFGTFLGVGASVFGPIGAVAGAVIGSLVGLFQKIFGRSDKQKEADKIVEVQNRVTADFAAILDSIREQQGSGTLTAGEIINAITAVQLVTDAFFDFTKNSGFKTVSAQQARETIGPLALSIIQDLNTLLDGFRPATASDTTTEPTFEEKQRNAFLGDESEDFPNNTVPELAHGGIVTRPTLAVIGEAGPEAVIPLDKMSSGKKVEFHLHVEGDINSEIDFENKVTRVVMKAAQGGAFSDIGINQ